MQVKTLDDALSLLVKRRVMTLAGTGTDRVPSLASAIAGKPVKGSWWSHPQGKLIFRLGNQLAEHKDVLYLRLGDKMTFVHRVLWPSLYRMATSAAQLEDVLRRGSADAALLFEKVRKAGTLAISKAEKELAAQLDGLVIQTQEHGESGAHKTVLRSFEDWAPKTIVAAAARLTDDRARKQLADALGWGASLLIPPPVVESESSRKKTPARKSPAPKPSKKSKQPKPSSRRKRR